MFRTRSLSIALLAALALSAGCASPRSSCCDPCGCERPSFKERLRYLFHPGNECCTPGCCDPCGPCCDGPILGDCANGCCPAAPVPGGILPAPAPLAPQATVPPLSAPPGPARIVPQPQQPQPQPYRPAT